MNEPVKSVAGAAPIVRRTLHDELVDRLREMIVEGDLTPGIKVPEKDLCEQFGVSRTPLREALKVLATEGLVELLPNRGARVATLTIAALEEAFPVMGALEALAGELACANIIDAEIATVRSLHEDMVRHYKAGALAPYFAANQAIHEAILEAARNPTLVTLHRGLAGRVRRARYMANMSAARWQKAVEEHVDILNALEARDGERLGTLLRAHLANKFATVRDALSANEAAE